MRQLRLPARPRGGQRGPRRPRGDGRPSATPTPCLQLLAPLTPDSAIAEFLDRSGPGMQQLAYRVTDIDAAMAAVRAQGMRLLYDEPRRGTADSRINFIHPKDAGGVLVELVEPVGRARAKVTVAGACQSQGPVIGASSVDALTKRPPCRRSSSADPAPVTPRRGLRRPAGPESYRGITVRKDEAGMFEGLASADKDPRKSLHLDEVPTPELGPGRGPGRRDGVGDQLQHRWTSIFEPVSTFAFLERYGRMSPLAKRHDLPYHVVGSDLAGVVLRTGPGVHTWTPGDEVVAHCLSVELESPDGHNDTMLDPEQRIWGFETNFGGLAQLALVKSNQLMPKPAHLTWEEAACPGLVNSTAYRSWSPATAPT